MPKLSPHFPRARYMLLVVGCITVGLLALYWYAPWSTWRVSRAINACLKEGPRKQQCFDDLILQSAREGGVSHAFDILSILYDRDQEFASFCHGNTHQIGELAFDMFEKGEDINISPKTSYCGFGFYHGFLEKLVYTHGDLSEARRFCAYVDSKLSSSASDASLACYHGIGHGVVDGGDPSRWGDAERYIEPGLSLCEQVSDVEEQKERCASGVFNALAIAYRKPEYNLHANPKDPYSICRLQPTPYVRRQCYDQMNGYIVWVSATFTDALRVAETSAESPEYAATGVRSVAGYRAKDALAEARPLSEYIRDCDSLSTISLRDDCAEGFAAGLIEFGRPGSEYVAAIQACAVSGERAWACFRGVQGEVKGRFTPDRQLKLCDDIGRLADGELVAECRRTMSGT